jgi:steroid delta-isomerase-like uncharacterized protein
MKPENEVSNAISRAQQNKDLVRRAVDEIWNGENYEKLDQFVSPEFTVYLSPEEKIHGLDGIKQFYVSLRQAFPDIHFTIQDQIAEGDKVVTQWTAHGTHRGEFKGIPASGKRFTLSAIDIDKVVDGKVVECWAKMDELGLLKQLTNVAVAQPD